MLNKTKISDEVLYDIVKRELERQEKNIEMIASESTVPIEIMELSGSIFTNKTLEGYPGHRFQAGSHIADELELLANKRGKELYGCDHINIQPYSGSTANYAVYAAILEKDDKVMSLSLDQGGHLSHGSKANFMSRFFHFDHYSIDKETEQIDYDGLEKKAKEFKPKLIITGGSAYPRLIDFKRIGKVAQRISPIMAIAYFLMSLVVIFFNIEKLPATFTLIFKSAFGKDAIFGAIMGQSIIWGIKRGVFANEVGVGSSAITSASAEVTHPVTQGMIGGLSVFMGTFFICTTSSLMMIITNSYNTVDQAGNMIVEYLPGLEYGNPYVINAINSVIPGIGEAFIAISVLCFSSVALLAYYLYAESDLIFLVGEKKTPILILKIIFIISVFIGCISSVDTVWTMGDMAHGLMAWINVFTIIFIGNQAVKIFKDYENEEKHGKLPVFNPEKLGLKDVAEIGKIMSIVQKIISNTIRKFGILSVVLTDIIPKFFLTTLNLLKFIVPKLY